MSTLLIAIDNINTVCEKALLYYVRILTQVYSVQVMRMPQDPYVTNQEATYNASNYMLTSIQNS